MPPEGATIPHLHLVGGELGKVIASFMYRNRCNVCSELHELVKKREDTNDCDLQTKLTRDIVKLKNHTCLKNLDGPLKSMETDCIVQLVLTCPIKLKVYMRVICMDDDTIMRSHIKEDMGGESSGCLPRSLCRIRVVADPSHRRRTITNWYFVLGN